MYRIGEFSKLSGLSDKTLRYYESIGLLIPDNVDEWSNYRFYSDSNLEEAKIIIMYKELGFSLNDIIELKNGVNENIVDNKIADLEEKRNVIDYQLYCLSALKTSIRKKDDKVISFNNKEIKKLCIEKVG